MASRSASRPTAEPASSATRLGLDAPTRQWPSSTACQCYYFDPTNEEVARYVVNWFWDQTVFDYAAENLHAIDRLTARMYVKASERRINGRSQLEE